MAQSVLHPFLLVWSKVLVITGKELNGLKPHMLSGPPSNIQAVSLTVTWKDSTDEKVEFLEHSLHSGSHYPPDHFTIEVPMPDRKAVLPDTLIF